MPDGRYPPNEPGVDAYTQLLTQAYAQRRLHSVHWELTYRCNERCTHCYLDVAPPGAPAPAELTTIECCRVIDQLAELGTLNLTFSGGEILVRRDFFAIAERARAQRFVLRLFTNGTFITPAVADRIADLHPFAVEVSLYGVDAATHDAVTQRLGSHARTLCGLHLLQARGVRTVCKTPLMHANVRQLDELRALAAALGAQFRYALTITSKIGGDPTPLRHRLTYADLLWFFRMTLEPHHVPEEPPAPGACSCAIARSALAIDAHGEVYPCLEVRRRAGNVRETPIRKIWEEAPIWRELAGLTVGRLPTCRHCALRSLCTRCHGLALQENGHLIAPALANCVQALARRQVLVEKGVPAERYSLPPHLLALGFGVKEAEMQTTMA